MPSKAHRDELEDLLAAIQSDAYENGSGGEICLSPLLDVSIDESEKNDTNEGDQNDELFT